MNYFVNYSSGRSVGAMGMVVSNAKDMTKWLNFMLSGGKNEDGEQIIDTDVLNAVFTPEMALDRSAVAQRPEDPVTMTGHETYAKGWRNGYYNGKLLISSLNDHTWAVMQVTKKKLTHSIADLSRCRKFGIG